MVKRSLVACTVLLLALMGCTTQPLPADDVSGIDPFLVVNGMAPMACGGPVIVRSGGCGPLGYRDGSAAVPMSYYAVRGNEIVLHYEGGSCPRGQISLRQQETATQVRVLAVLGPPPPAAAGTACGGVGLNSTLTAVLLRPLGTRTVVDASRSPSQVVPDEAQNAQDAIDRGNALAMCADLERLTHGQLRAWSITDVATVRADVPASRVAWAKLDGRKLAADCYLTIDDGTTIVVDHTAGLPSIVRDHDYLGTSYPRLPSIPGHPARD